jgi:hypothetical protein
LAETPSDHVLTGVGNVVTQIEAMRELLKGTADAIDRDPKDDEGRAHYRALVVRQVVHDLATEVLVNVGTTGGARPLCHDLEQSRRAADLFVYLSQHHGGSDAIELGRLVREEGWWL